MPRLWPWAAYERQLTGEAGRSQKAAFHLSFFCGLLPWPLSMVGCSRQSEINSFIPELLLLMVFTTAAEKDRKIESPSSSGEIVEVIAQGRNKKHKTIDLDIAPTELYAY